MSQPALPVSPAPAVVTTAATSSSSTSTTTTTTTGTSSASDSSHRNCRTCRRRIPGIKFDRHTICFSCRDQKCDLTIRCPECLDWSVSEMEDLIKHRQKLVSKSKRKPEVSIPVSLSPDEYGQAAYEHIDNIESASTSTSPGTTSSAHVEKFLADLVGNFLTLARM